jgi:ActR/RegA family two-component response regulator
MVEILRSGMIPTHKRKVLVVDDDIAMGRFLAAHMIRRGFEVTNASGDDEALRALRVW